MPRFAANLDWLFTDLPFLERFSAAAECGFRGVEFLFPYDYSAEVLRRALVKNKLELVLFNVYAGDWRAGERGIASHPERSAEFGEASRQALEYATALGCPRLHVLAGLDHGSCGRETQRRTYVENLRTIAEAASPFGITILVEAINQIDMPGYFVRSQAEALAICAETRMPNVRVQLDLYHCQMTEGRLADRVSEMAGLYGHVQIANVPGRHEPDCGEVNFDYVLDCLDRTGYSGWVGCEYRPVKSTLSGLKWFTSRLSKQSTGSQCVSGLAEVQEAP